MSKEKTYSQLVRYHLKWHVAPINEWIKIGEYASLEAATNGQEFFESLMRREWGITKAETSIVKVTEEEA